LLIENYEALQLGWFWATDEDGRLTYISESIHEMLEKNGGVIGRPLIDLFLPGEEDDKRTLPFQLARRNKFEGVAARVRIDGRERWYSLSGRAQYAGKERFTGFIGHGIDITAERASAESSNKLAMYDPLTGLLNRRHMGQYLEAALSASRTMGRPCALLQIDLDRFKQVNDSLGHPIGDALLKQVAERLQLMIGDRGKVCRIGGDEFQVAVPDQDDRGYLGTLGESIINTLSQPYSIGGSRCNIGASIGIAVSPFDGDTSEVLVRNADLALYSAKGAGRGRFCFFSEQLSKAAEDRRQLEQDLLDAISKGQFEVCYQPIVSAETNGVVLFEALIRWHHPTLGSISPSDFIPIAEETKQIVQIGEWTLRKACEDAAAWPKSLKVAVNVSPIQFAEENFVTTVASVLAHTGISPDRLELEITEGVFLSESEDNNSKFAALKALGVRLVLDDFGTGYSSLGYLKSAPFDKIKIDQSFIRGATVEGSRNRAIIAAIVALADALGMETTAEGIESFDQLQMVKNLKVKLIQGFLFSQAVANGSVSEHLADGGGWTIQPSGPARQRAPRFAMLRRIGVVHENHRYSALMRNVSESGALIEGLLDVPVGTQFVLDLGEGQLAVAVVRRSTGEQQGVEFEQKLVSDGQGGLCTRHRVSPYAIAAAGGLFGESKIASPLIAKMESGSLSLPSFRTKNDWA
jgi:diguanylate cyclase (GGDEF)-like protein/PAS domain S-box-containing protein